MPRFTVIPEDTFEGLQLDAGVLLRTFDPANPVAPDDEDIICATTGGINPSCVPTYSDMGEDVDNCPNNMKELKHLDSWECKFAFTALGVSPENIRMALGAADIDAQTGAIVPRRNLSQSDFADLWWVGDRADGGMVAIKLHNALSTGGFSLQTTKSGKGQVSCELTGHVSMDEQDTMPMTFYSANPDAPVVPDITLNKANATIAVDGTVQLKAKTVPNGETVTWSTSNSSYATVEDGLVTGKGVGVATITATMSYDSGTYTDTCRVTVESAG